MFSKLPPTIMFSMLRKTKNPTVPCVGLQCDDSVIALPNGCLDENLQLTTYVGDSNRPGTGCITTGQPGVSLNISDILYTITASILLARRILFETARLKRSVFAVGPVKLSAEAYYVDEQLMKMEKCLGTGGILRHSENINQDLVLKGPTLQKALFTARKSFLDLEKAFDNTVLAELKNGMIWKGRGSVDHKRLVEVIKDMRGQIYRIWDSFHTVYNGELEAMNVAKTQEDHVDPS